MRTLIIALCLAATVAHAANTEAKFILPGHAQPGTTVLVGVQLKMNPGWHTYWKYPGQAGQATEIKWTLPPGVTAGEIQWPLPEKLPPDDVTTYGYEHEVVLLVPLTLDKNIAPGPLNLAAKVSWLECKEACIPASAEIQDTLNAGPTAGVAVDLYNEKMLAGWLAKVPAVAGKFPALAGWGKPAAADNTRPLDLQWPGNAKGADFFPATYDDFEVLGATELLPAPAGEIRLRKMVKKFSGDWPKEITGVFVTAAGAVEAKVAIGSPLAGVGNTSAADPLNNLGESSKPLWLMLIYAFIGGLILNIMPCVLPVIALKILGFVNEAGSSPRRLRALGGLYGLGVLVSFVVLASIVIGIKAAGHLAGWGMQFGNPVFLVCLTTLVTLVALNLFGVFEVTLGGGALDAAGTLASKHGAAGAFFNGVLATVLATPCTAPILGTALGFAFAQGAVVVLLIFLTVGLGLAAPYVLLCWNPAWLRLLPKPGAWMEKFKMAMGFPMLATAVWLLNISASTYGKKVLWLGIFLVVVACAAWIYGEFFQRGRHRRGLALAVSLVFLFAGYAYALEGKLRWRAAVAETVPSGSLKESPEGIDWQAWSPEAVARARSEGRPVLVDFTADWCATCQLNKATSIEITAVREKLKAINAVALLGDHTRTPKNILMELNRFARAGVPLVLVYPKDATAPPIVLPELLTPSIVLNALEQAAK